MVAYPHERALLFQALASKHGIVLRTVDLERDIAALKAAKSGEPLLRNVEVWRSPWDPKEEIWLVKILPKPSREPTTPGSVPPPAVEDGVNISLDDLGLF